MPDPEPKTLTFGWEEWISLPDLDLPAISVKVDTGARTSALHAAEIERFGTDAAPKVRFQVFPIPGRRDLSIACSADVVDQREVTSSNGDTELRYVILTTLSVAGESWPIEITLTDRSNMASRMLLGRQALKDHIAVAATERHLQPVLSYDVYKSARVSASAPPRALRIAVLSRERNYTTRQLVETGQARGHTVEVIDTTRCYMAINTLASEVHYDGKRLPRFDAVIPRVGTSITPYAAAVIRQFESIGTYCVNSSSGIAASRDRLHAHQILAGRHIGLPATGFAASPRDTDNLLALVGTDALIVKLLESTHSQGVILAETRKAAEAVISAFRDIDANFLVQDFIRESAGVDIRCMVIGTRVVASVRRTGIQGDFRSSLKGATTSAVKITRDERDAALRAAKAFRLGMASVEMLRSSDGPKILEVSSSPGFQVFDKSSGKTVAGALYDMIEKRARARPARRRKAAR